MSALDITNRFHHPGFQDSTIDWRISRHDYPIRAVILHHSAGFYGATLSEGSLLEQDQAQIDAMAADHFNRFGIGPGYNYVACPSGRLFAVGKVGTHRAHTKGRNPEDRGRWNIDGVAICALGNYEVDEPGELLKAAIRRGINEIRGFSVAASPTIPLYPHGSIPTVDSRGHNFPQGTACPGKHLIDAFGKDCPVIDLSDEARQLRTIENRLHVLQLEVEMVADSLERKST